ncbi:50S ribosomal protein L35ae [Candidatus Bathyarchaeota archaeon]|nr:50S ribosomal protein L35ae [Candidatus Bathyarchaeota archaeon]
MKTFPNPLRTKPRCRYGRTPRPAIHNPPRWALDSLAIWEERREWNAFANAWTTRGRHLSYQRSKHAVTPKTSLIQIEGVENQEGARYASS